MLAANASGNAGPAGPNPAFMLSAAINSAAIAFLEKHPLIGASHEADRMEKIIKSVSDGTVEKNYGQSFFNTTRVYSDDSDDDDGYSAGDESAYNI